MTVQFLEISNLESRTSGLKDAGFREIQTKSEKYPHDDRVAVLKFIADYLINSSDKIIKTQETIGYGSWVLKLKDSKEGNLEIWELNQNGEDYDLGADFSIGLLSKQRRICKENEQECLLPSADRMIVLSPDVLSSNDIEGVRYKAPKHMSGWWLYTETYDGDIEKMKPHHIVHLIGKRPDIAQYLGLPPGHRFELKTGAVWFDENVKNQENQ